MKSNEKSRRSFLKNSTLLTAASAFPSIWTSSTNHYLPGPANLPAKDKVNLACIGIGNQGGSDVMSFAKTGLANFVAFCDVDMGLLRRELS